MEFAWMVIYVLSFIWDLVTAEFEKAASLKVRPLRQRVVPGLPIIYGAALKIGCSSKIGGDRCPYHCRTAGMSLGRAVRRRSPFLALQT
jgi:hypothetical protein